MNYDVIIIGGGAGGLMCQYQLAQTNLNILLIEKTSQLGKKLLLTGNGRCNVTNNLSPRDFIEQIRGHQKKFLYKALHMFPPREIVRFFESKGLALQLENGYQYFPTSNKAKDVLDILSESSDNVTIHHQETVKEIRPNQSGYTIITNKDTYQTKRVIVSTGSKSFPKTGSTGDGLMFASQLGLETTQFYPAETKVYANMIEELGLQGIQVKEAKVRLKNTKIFRVADLLFTHDGLSGPVIYHLSEDIYHHLKENKRTVLSIDLLNISYPTFLELLEESNTKMMETVFAKLTSKRLASTIFSHMTLPKKQIKDLQEETYKTVYEALTNFDIPIKKVEDVSLAYVNGGGVSTKELSPATMEAKKFPGLYFIGETIDIHGPIGGFNLTIAFSTAYLATAHIKEVNNA